MDFREFQYIKEKEKNNNDGCINNERQYENVNNCFYKNNQSNTNINNKEYDYLTDSFKEFADSYGNLTNKQLENMIIEQFKSNICNGMKIDEVENLYNQIEPMLDLNSKELLKKLIEETKNVK